MKNRDRLRSKPTRIARRERRAAARADAEARTIASLEAQVGPAEDRIDWQHVDRLRASIGLPPQST